MKSKTSISTSGDSPRPGVLFTSFAPEPGVVSNYPNKNKGAAATGKDRGNEKGITRTALTEDAGSGRTFAGSGEIATLPRTSKNAESKHRLTSPGSAKTGYEPAVDNCQVLPLLLFPSRLNLVAGVAFVCLNTHRTSKDCIRSCSRKLAGNSLYAGSGPHIPNAQPLRPESRNLVPANHCSERWNPKGFHPAPISPCLCWPIIIETGVTPR